MSPIGSFGNPVFNHQKIKMKASEKVEKEELRTSRSLIEDITSLEHIEEALTPSIEFNQLNCNIRIGFLWDEECILYASKASTNNPSIK